ncbi:MAG: hypothetical protein LBE17_01380 [Treponema sp.]|jgi:hypothetical protein|nr:hypothetical protein [Treponema sp.]
MTRKLIAITALCIFFLPVFLYGQRQPPPAPASLAELDQLLIETAIRLDLRLRALPGESAGQTPRISAGDFLLMDKPVILSAIWKNGILDTLAAIQNRTYILRDAAGPPGDYLLLGIILQAGNSVRITTRIVRVSDSALIASWNSDLAKTPFVTELLEAAGDSSSAPADRHETGSRESYSPVDPVDIRQRQGGIK